MVAAVVLTQVVDQVAGSETPWSFAERLGSFAFGAAIMYLWLRDVRSERDRLSALLNQILPLLTRVEDTMRASTEVHRLSAESTKAMVDAMEHMPTAETWVRVADLARKGAGE